MIVLCTFPRSGSHFLFDSIFKKFGKSVPKNHWKVYGDDFYVISMIRDPKDTICSLIAMRPNEDDLDKKIDQALSRYILFYEYISERADLVFDFDEVISNTEKILETLNNNINIEDIIEYKDYRFSYDKSVHNFGKIESSKQQDKYERIKGMVERMDLSRAYELYHSIKNSLISL